MRLSSLVVKTLAVLSVSSSFSVSRGVGNGRFDGLTSVMTVHCRRNTTVVIDTSHSNQRSLGIRTHVLILTL